MFLKGPCLDSDKQPNPETPYPHHPPLTGGGKKSSERSSDFSEATQDLRAGLISFRICAFFSPERVDAKGLDLSQGRDVSGDGA